MAALHQLHVLASDHWGLQWGLMASHDISHLKLIILHEWPALTHDSDCEWSTCPCGVYTISASLSKAVRCSSTAPRPLLHKGSFFGLLHSICPTSVLGILCYVLYRDQICHYTKIPHPPPAHLTHTFTQMHTDTRTVHPLSQCGLVHIVPPMLVSFSLCGSVCRKMDQPSVYFICEIANAVTEED